MPSKPYSPGRYPGGTGLSPGAGWKHFTAVTEGTQRNDKNPCLEAWWEIQKRSGAPPAELGPSRSAEESEKLFRYWGLGSKKRQKYVCCWSLAIFYFFKNL